jgi:FkbM family methyltransferase
LAAELLASDAVGMRPAERQLLADTLAQNDRLAFWQETLDQAPCLEPEVYADSQWDAVIRTLIEEQSACLQALLQEAARSSEQENENQNDQRMRRFEAEVCLLRSCEAWINALPDLNRQDPLRVYLANQLVPVVGRLHQWLVIEDAQGSERGEWFWQGCVVLRCCCQQTEGMPPWWEPVREQLVRYAALEWLSRTQTEAGESRFEPESIVRTLVLLRALSTLHEPTPIWIVQALHETLRYGFAPLLSVESLGGNEGDEALLQSVLNWLNLLESTENNPQQTTTREPDQQTSRTDSLEAIWDGLQRTELSELVPENLLKKLEELKAAAVQTEISTQPAAPTMLVERKDLEQADLQSTTAAAAVENETPIASPSEGAVVQKPPEERTAEAVATAPRQNVKISMGETLLLAGLQEQALEVLAKGLPEWVPTEQRASHARLLASQMLVRAGLWKEAEALHAEAVRAIDPQRLNAERLAAELDILRTEGELLSHELSLALSQGSLAIPATPAGGKGREKWQCLSRSQLGQDLWVLEQLNWKPGGYFVEFGATDGVLLSNTWLLEKHFGWQGICAEPNPKLFERLKQNRSCLTSPACIYRSTGERMRFVLADAYGGLEVLGQDDQHVNKRNAYAAAGDLIEVTTTSLMDLLQQNQAPPVIDYLSIDTEGSELEILAGIDWGRHQFRCITVEHNFTAQREGIQALLEAQDYQRLEAQWDDWYWKEID